MSSNIVARNGMVILGFRYLQSFHLLDNEMRNSNKEVL
ncbi:hypothetical protein FM109_07840 [Vibrio casei]|nr:hypothetical protein FM109_07840 [Vibrio casei]